ncbi:MAG TPA: polyprenyl synthetase family protein [Spirochaetota bacterium]|nr:polyprenyl synthetase family protein [Spirochaetota bacterium]
MELRQILSTKSACVESWLHGWMDGLGKAERYPRRLLEAAAWSLFAGGKRLRPALCLLVNDACGSPEGRVLPLAGALEMIHTYSLIHDDLPPMDDDELRRGIPTCHIKFDEATAILAGDALLTEAFACLATLDDRDVIPDIVSGLARAAGFGGMVAGQMADIGAERGYLPGDSATLEFIHANKTGALLEASVLLPGLVNHLDSDRIAELAAYGRSIGLAFQIADDVLNETADAATLGKPTGTDREAGKLTWTSIHGIEKAREMANREVENACRVLADWGPAAEPLRMLARYMVEREY